MKGVAKGFSCVFEDKESCKELQNALKSITIATVFAATPDNAIRLSINHEYCLASISDTDGQRLLKIMQTIHPCRFCCYPQTQKHPDRLAAFSAGANAYLGKPYGLEECAAQAKMLIRLYNDLESRKSGNSTLLYGTDPIKQSILAGNSG